MNYKVKRGLLFIGYYNIKNLLSFEKDVDLNEQQKSFVSYWKNMMNDQNSLFFETRNEGNQISYEIHNLKDDSYITLKNDYKDAIIELFMLKNGILIQYYSYIPVGTSNRLIKSFKTELNKRANYLKDKFNDQLINNIKELN